MLSGSPPIWKDVYEENEQLYARWESLKAKEILVNKSETVCGDIDPNFLVAAGKHSVRLELKMVHLDQPILTH